MNGRRIGSCVVINQGDGESAALIVHCPALRSAGASLMLAMFGVACSVIAIAATIGRWGAGSEALSNLLALAFAGVLVIPLFVIGTLFCAIALWSAFNSRTVVVAAHGVRIERRWCGIALSRQSLATDSITALESRREARFTGIFSDTRHYRLLVRNAAGKAVLADHLAGGAQTEEIKKLLLNALARPDLADSGRSDHHRDTRGDEDTAGA